MAGSLRIARPALKAETLLLSVIAFLLVTSNGSWWSAATNGRDWSEPGSWLFVAACFTGLAALHFLVLAPFASRWTVRPLLTVIVIASAAAAYYMRSYGVVMDEGMMGNVLATDWREVRELASGHALVFVILLSAVPVAFIWWVRIERGQWPKAVALRAASMLAALLVAALALLPISRDLTSMMRNQHEMRYLITPGNFLHGFAMQVLHDSRDLKGEKLAVGTDARIVRTSKTDRPRVLVLVVGETARAQNLSLLGYSRDTTPELAQADVIGFQRVKSCGTDTEVSLPCMFSPFGRADYDEHLIRNSEGMLHVLARAGYAVKWIENQSGCKGVCVGAGIEYQHTRSGEAGGLCDGSECYDEVLLKHLRAELDAVHRDSVIVLHMMGNHGPAYYRRYPPAFRRFTPDCTTAELRHCSREEVLNAYDNAILYSDHVLAATVRMLASDSSRLDAAMLYVSDHGESLGERGLYLHGLPYAIAPAAQTHVPMIAWLSPQFAVAGPFDLQCVRAKADEVLSHDNLFHSVLGMLDVETSAYDAGRDMFRSCRRRNAGQSG